MVTVYEHPYVNDLPRYGLALVFLLFGIDKFTLHGFYVSWFTATERVRMILPVEDVGLAVYIIGIAELVMAAALFSGKKVRWSAAAVTIWMIVILATARYPSSFPQDIGLLGISVLLILTDAAWKGAGTSKFMTYSWIPRYAIAAVLVIWAIDHATNVPRHVGWIQFSSLMGQIIPASDTSLLVITLVVVELAIAGLISTRKLRINGYSLIAATVFLLFAKFALAPPLNNHQSIGLAFVTFWLWFLSHARTDIGKKERLESR